MTNKYEAEGYWFDAMRFTMEDFGIAARIVFEAEKAAGADQTELSNISRFSNAVLRHYPNRETPVGRIANISDSFLATLVRGLSDNPPSIDTVNLILDYIHDHPMEIREAHAQLKENR